MVVANGWPLLEQCKSCDYEAIARLRLALKSRLNAAVGGADDISNIPWRVSEHKFIVEAFATIVRFLLPRTAGDKEFFLGVTEEGDTEALKCCALLLGSGGTGVITHSAKQTLFFLFVVAVSKRAAARRTETAFKRSLCVYILAIIATDILNYSGDVNMPLQPMVTTTRQKVSTYALEQIKRWRKEFVEVESVIKFVEWRKVQSPKRNLLLYTIALPVGIGVAWYFVAKYYGGGVDGDASNGASFVFSSWKEYAISFCLISILVSIVISTMYKDDLSNSGEKIRMAEWTLVEMCCILRPPKAESVTEIYSSSVRQKDTKEATVAVDSDTKNAKVVHHSHKGDHPVGDKDRKSEAGKSTPIMDLQFPNDLTEKLEKLVAMMQADKACDPAELDAMKARLRFAKNIEDNGEGREYVPGDESLSL